MKNRFRPLQGLTIMNNISGVIGDMNSIIVKFPSPTGVDHYESIILMN